MLVSFKRIKTDLYIVSTVVEDINIHLGEHTITVFKQNEEPKFIMRINQTIEEIVKEAIKIYMEVSYDGEVSENE